MAKRPSFAALQEPTPEPVAPAPVKPEAAELADDSDQPMLPIKAPKIAKVRRGKRIIAGYFPLETAKAVRLLAVEQDKTVEALLGEAINLVLRQYGKHPQPTR